MGLECSEPVNNFEILTAYIYRAVSPVVPRSSGGLIQTAWGSGWCLGAQIVLDEQPSPPPKCVDAVGVPSRLVRNARQPVSTWQCLHDGAHGVEPGEKRSTKADSLFLIVKTYRETRVILERLELDLGVGIVVTDMRAA